jgi:glycosyltransferase involved in cell wall biosynthesis
MRASLIIPAHNEQNRIGPTLRVYGEALYQNYGDEFEIIVVANGCTDNTVQEAQEAARIYPQIRVIDVRQAIGKGGAILEGFRQAYGQRVAFADADGATAPESLISLIERLDTYDVVIGSRYLPESSITTKQSVLRRVLSYIFTATVYLIFGLPYHDTQCGAKAFRRAAALLLAQVVSETRWVFDVDLLLSARALDLDVTEHPVVWADKAGSQMRILPTSREVLGSFWSLWRAQLRRSSPERQPSLYPGRPPAPDETHVPASGTLPRLRILALNWRCTQHPQAGGSEVNLFEQAHLWVEEGHNVTVVTADPGREYVPSQHEIIDGIEVRRMGGRLTVYLFAAWFLIRHGHEYDCVLDIANGVPFFAPLFCPTPVTLLVHHVHDRQWFEEFPYPVAMVGRAVERWLMPLVYHGRPVIGVSPTTREALIELGFSPSQIYVVYNGVHLPLAWERRAEPRRHTVAYVGRIKHYKRIDRLVRTVADLRDEFPDIHLDIAGDGDGRADVEALIQQLDLADCVTVYGPVDEQEKAEILSRATVFATASTQEGWGISVLEANAYGCPAVAYDVPGLSVAIRHGTTGLLASDDDGFEEALALIMHDGALRARLGKAARQWASMFDWRSAAEATLKVLYSGTLFSPSHIPDDLWQSISAEASIRLPLAPSTEPLLESQVGGWTG